MSFVIKLIEDILDLIYLKGLWLLLLKTHGTVNSGYHNG